MASIKGFDHVAVTVADMETTCRWYGELFGAQPVEEHAVAGRVLVRQIAIGGALLSVHQSGNGVELVAKRPTVGAADICLRWDGAIESAVALLREHGIEIIEGPTPVAQPTACQAARCSSVILMATCSNSWPPIQAEALPSSQPR